MPAPEESNPPPSQEAMEQEQDQALTSTASPTPTATDPSEFCLSKVFSAHKQDIKAVIGTPTGALVTASRDEMVKFWTERAGTFKETTEINAQHQVNSAAFYQSPTDAKWLLFAGLKDGTIAVYNTANSKPLAVLVDHSSNVCCLYADAKEQVLLSGSWDARAVVWSIEQILSGEDIVPRELTRHAHSIWAVATLPSSPTLSYLTASADKTIRLLDSIHHKVLHVFEGHTDVVRALVVLSSNQFASTANDGTVRLWDANSGQCLQKIDSVAGEFIYTMVKVNLRSGLSFLVAGGEGGHFEFYRILQANDSSSLTHLSFHQKCRLPVSSVWSITELRNNDIALGCNTGQVYVYTTNKAKFASEELLNSFDAEFASILQREMAASESDTVTINVSLDDGAPTMKLTYTKGTNPADTAEGFIKEHNLPISYLPEITQYIESNVPEAANYQQQQKRKVVAGPTPMTDAEKFDYSFEVTLDGKVCTLGYNVGEDPDFASQRFVEKHNLPVKFLKQFSTFLRAQVPELSAPTFVDPFTGSGRYVPGRGGPSSTNEGAADPLTGGGRYIPSSNGSGHSSYSQSANRDKTRPRGDLIPMKDFFLFGVESASAKAAEKLKEMNSLQPEELQLTDAQLSALSEIMSSPSYIIREKDHIGGLHTGLQWSLETIAPCMDAFRLAMLNESLNRFFCQPPQLSDTLHRLSLLLISDPPVPLRAFACRALANAAAHQWGQQLLVEQPSHISKVLMNHFLFPNKAPVQVAAASAVANLAFVLLQSSERSQVAELGPREDVLRCIVSATEGVESFGDYSPVALVRLLQAISTLMWGDGAVIRLAKNKGVVGIVAKIKDAVSAEEAKALCRDITVMCTSI